MVKRKKIGLFFIYGEAWAGGYYYLLNIIYTLNHLPEAQKPILVIFYYDSNIRGKITDTCYPFLQFLPIDKPLSLADRLYNKIKKMIFDRSFQPQYSENTVDFIFPFGSVAYDHIGSIRRLRKIYWIPDFQHKHLPHFFSEEEIAERDKNFIAIAGLKEKIVLSSEDARADYLRFYPENNNQVVVMPFVSLLPALEKVNVKELLSKYNIQQPYFMSPNQFWAHKNHLTLLKAITLLKESGLNFQVVFTGKEEDYRNLDYVAGLKRYIKENSIETYVRFLGFIDRTDQLMLMKNAIVVVQPSLFEGWSTVVEDAKAMNQAMILSALDVHREQCGDDAIYFEPLNEHELASCMKQYLEGKSKRPSFQDYEKKIQNYAHTILSL